MARKLIWDDGSLQVYDPLPPKEETVQQICTLVRACSTDEHARWSGRPILAWHYTSGMHVYVVNLGQLDVPRISAQKELLHTIDDGDYATTLIRVEGFTYVQLNRPDLRPGAFSSLLMFGDTTTYVCFALLRDLMRWSENVNVAPYTNRRL